MGFHLKKQKKFFSFSAISVENSVEKWITFYFHQSKSGFPQCFHQPCGKPR
jgi:hypothetical protein